MHLRLCRSDHFKGRPYFLHRKFSGTMFTISMFSLVPGGTIKNLSLGYEDAMAEPVNTLITFQRLTFIFRNLKQK